MALAELRWSIAQDPMRRDSDRLETPGRARLVTTHDLRATAVTMMRDLGVPKEAAAARVGHADAGELVDTIYDLGNRAARAAKALRAVAPGGLRAAAEAATRRASTPDGAYRLGLHAGYVIPRGDVAELAERLDHAGDTAGFARALGSFVELAGGSIPVQVDGDELVVRTERGDYRLRVTRVDQ